MAIFRCKMCGGDIEVMEGTSTCTCEFCGTQQTIPTVKEEELQVLFNRANVLRIKSEFDKAAEIYEKILQKSESEAEAYWGLILCKYGIEYVEDPQTFRRVPTCHRASYDAVTADEDYRNAVRYADSIQREIYEREAKAIDEIQRGIVTLAQKEEPYDVFICYKETDENGQRTQDSVIANDIYYQLVQEGFQVFYAAITLENKLGTEYEPYIFSALNTAKVMLSIGTRPEYFQAVWVKNEWSRFLKIMKEDRSKLLIPCYKDMDPYELPEEFIHLQAQDMGKIGFINDIVRGIRKVIIKKEMVAGGTTETQASAPVYSFNITALIKRGNMALEDHEWDKADGFFEKVLNQDAECAEAYVGKLLAAKKVSTISEYIEKLKMQYKNATAERLKACPEETAYIKKAEEDYALPGYQDKETIEKLYFYDRSYQSFLSCRNEQKEKQLSELAGEKLLNRAKQYAKGELRQEIENGLRIVEETLSARIAQAQEEDMESIARVTEAYKAHIKEADDKAKHLRADAESRQEQDYQTCVAAMKASAEIQEYERIGEKLKSMNGYRDTTELAEKCQEEVERLREEKRLEIERRTAAKQRKEKRTVSVVAAVVAAAIVAGLVATYIIIPDHEYNTAVALMNEADYIGAYELLDALDNYKDSTELKNSIENEYQMALFQSAEIGSEVAFGTYEQDNNNENGQEPIEWIALEKNDDRLLLISKDILDCRQYHLDDTNTDITWEDCSLRSWLNETFYDAAFSVEEQAMIKETTVMADKNPEYATNPGNNTVDKVFLLSITEVEKYFGTDEERQCEATSYAVANGANEDYKGDYIWWLRSPGYSSNYAAYVDTSGYIEYYGDYVASNWNCVRPALWINLEP